MPTEGTINKIMLHQSEQFQGTLNLATIIP